MPNDVDLSQIDIIESIQKITANHDEYEHNFVDHIHICKLQQKNECLQQQISKNTEAMQNKLEKKDAIISKNTEQICSLKNRVAELQQESQQKDEVIGERMGTINNLKQYLDEQLQNTKVKLEGLNKQYQESEEKNTKLMKDITCLKQKMETLDKELHEKMDDVESKIDLKMSKLQDVYKGMEEKLVTTVKTNSDLIQECERLRGLNKSHLETINGLKGEMNGIKIESDRKLKELQSKQKNKLGTELVPKNKQIGKTVKEEQIAVKLRKAKHSINFFQQELEKILSTESEKVN